MPDFIWTFVVVGWTVFVVTYSVTKLKMHRCGGGIYTFNIPIIDKQKWLIRAIMAVYIVSIVLFSLNTEFPLFDNVKGLEEYFFISRGALFFVVAGFFYIYSRITVVSNCSWTGGHTGDRRKLIKRGPYKFICHPQSTAYISALFSTGLMLTDSRIIIFTCLFIPFLYAKSIIDEQYLYMIFKDYPDYIEKTDRFI